MQKDRLFVNDKVRCIIVKALAKHFKLDIDVVEPTDEYKNDFPLELVPGYKSLNGFKLNEVLAISFHLIKIGDPESQLLGKNDKQLAEILKWFSMSNTELINTLINIFYPLIGKKPYVKKTETECHAKLEKIVGLYEDRLKTHTYLVGERLSLADLFSATIFIRGFDYLFGSSWREAHPELTRWFLMIINSKIIHDVIGDYKFIDLPLKQNVKKNQPSSESKKSKVEQKKEAIKEKIDVTVEKKTKKETIKEQIDVVVEKKPKHPLEVLGSSKAPLDAWKRYYSNEDTREKAIPWFWKNQYDDQDWSLWKVDYKYNNELTLTFMSNNLIGGFFNRLYESTKYMFGCLVVYGVNNNNGITGFFIVRGQDYIPAFSVAPDWESYNYTKLDPNDLVSKNFINNMLAWDEPVVVDGVSYVISDGKVFK